MRIVERMPKSVPQVLRHLPLQSKYFPKRIGSSLSSSQNPGAAIAKSAPPNERRAPGREFRLKAGEENRDVQIPAITVGCPNAARAVAPTSAKRNAG